MTALAASGLTCAQLLEADLVDRPQVRRHARPAGARAAPRIRPAAARAARAGRPPCAPPPRRSERSSAGCRSRAVEKSPSSGEIRMSVGLSEASEAWTFCSVRMLSIWPVTPRIEFSSSRFSSGVPTLTAMTMSAPIARAASTGRLLVSMPSTSIMPSNSAGATAPGTDMLARITLASSPSLKTTALPVTRSVATARNGIGSSSNRW